MDRTNYAIYGAILVGGALLLGGCRSRQQDEWDEDLLAMVNDTAITTEDFTFEVQRRLESGRPIQDAETVLDELIERELMLQRAKTSDRLQDPVVQRELENQVLVAWLDDALHTQRDGVRVSEDDLRAAYEERLDAFTRPALMRLAILYRRRSPLDPEETQVSLHAELEQARVAYLQDPESATRSGRLQGFGTIAAAHSEHTVSRYRGGDLGWFDPQGGVSGVPDPVLSAGASLVPGAVSEILAFDDGLYVVMKTGEREAQVTPYEEAVIVLRRRLIRERQDLVEEQFRAALREGASISVHADKVRGLEVPSGSARIEQQAPQEMRVP